MEPSNNEFEKALEAALNSVTLTEVESNGKLLVLDKYINAGLKIESTVYRYNSKLYHIRYINDKCDTFRDLTLE